MTYRRDPDTSLYRAFCLLAAVVYILWWFFVEWLLATSFNPLGSRLAVTGVFIALWALSFPFALVRAHLRVLFKAGLWLLTAHFFYLFYGNHGEADWIIGSFITILGVSYFFTLPAHLLSYSGFVLAVCAALLVALPGLRHSVFFPGVATILLQANIGLFARRRMQARLRESNDRFQLLFHSAAEGILVHEARVIRESNAALDRLFGYLPGELVGSDILQLVDPAYHDVALERIRLADATPYELLGSRKDGSTVDVEARAKEFAYDGKVVRLVILRDLSYRKRIEEERLNLRAARERAQALDDFVTQASHELKTPLTSAKLWTQMLQRQAEGAADAQTLGRTAALVSSQIGRLAQLVEAMLNASQVSSGRVRLELKRVDLSALAREAELLIRPEADRLGMAIAAKLEGPLFVLGDETRLLQVIGNLLSNALKYGQGQPVQFSLAAEGNEAVLRVADQGPGILPADRERIFARFERADPRSNVSGLGLGLYLVKSLTEAHGGSVAVASEPGRGSTFSVRLPLSVRNTP